MSIKELVALTITAFLGAFAKEAFSLLIRRAPGVFNRLGRLLAPVIAAFFRRYWRVVFDVFGLALSIGLFAWISRAFPTIDHGTVYFISLTAAWQIYWLAELGRDLRRSNDAV